MIDLEQFQLNVSKFIIKAFDEDTLFNDKERCFRFLEEAAELAQVCGLEKHSWEAIGNHVFSKPIGRQEIEVGQVLLTLTALSTALGENIGECGLKELDRINNENAICKMKERHDAKPKEIKNEE